MSGKQFIKTNPAKLTFILKIKKYPFTPACLFPLGEYLWHKAALGNVNKSYECWPAARENSFSRSRRSSFPPPPSLTGLRKIGNLVFLIPALPITTRQIESQPVQPTSGVAATSILVHVGPSGDTCWNTKTSSFVREKIG